MGRKTRFTKEQKINAILDYKKGIRGVNQLKTDLGIRDQTFRTWIVLYEAIGESAFDDKPRNQQYTKEFKLQVIIDYLNGAGTIYGLMKKYKIYSSMTIRNWIKEYNNSGELKDYKPNIEVYTMKARKTTFEERVALVSFCIEHGKDYIRTVKEYGVSYEQIYSWVRKYEHGGADALVDRRGKRKPQPAWEELTETERLQAENRLLKAENEELKLANRLLKKVRDLEGSW